jgi:hypothetical protein
MKSVSGQESDTSKLTIHLAGDSRTTFLSLAWTSSLLHVEACRKEVMQSGRRIARKKNEFAIRLTFIFIRLVIFLHSVRKPMQDGCH